MIPKKKKSPEEIAALRNELGVHRPESDSEQPKTSPSKPSPEPTQRSKPRSQQFRKPTERDHRSEGTSNTEQEAVRTSAMGKSTIVHLTVEDEPTKPTSKKPVSHSFRKKEPPLAPAPALNRTQVELPAHRNVPKDMMEIRKRETLANLSRPQVDPAAYLKKITAHPALLIIAYLTTIGAAISTKLSSEYFTPLVLVVISLLMTAYIFLAKKRSRHHSAILVIVIIMTTAFGSLHFFPNLPYAP